MIWGPALTLKWGPYIRLDATDEKTVVDVARTAKDAGLVTRAIAVERVKAVFGIEDVSAVLDALDEEDAKSDAREERRLGAAVKTASEPNDALADDVGG